MGQYYEMLFIDERKYMYPIDYDWSGLKLMEQSWVGQTFRNAVIGHLMTMPDGCRLAHIGDYSEEEPKEKFVSLEIDGVSVTYSSMYDMCWTSGIEDRFKMPRISDREIVNFKWRKTVWVADEELHEYIRCDFDTTDNEWKICPLLILLSVGNGQGGGDYHGTNMDRVGSWAFHRIKVYYDEPDWMYNLELSCPLFVEGQ